MIAQQFPVFRGGYALLLFEQAAEIHRIFVADNSRYFVHIIICCFKQADCVVDAVDQYVVHGGHACYLLKVAEKPANTHTAGYCKFLDIDVFVVMLVEIPAGIFHFVLKISVYGRLLLHA